MLFSSGAFAMSRVRALMQRGYEFPYAPTESTMRWWFHQLNRELFWGKLPPVTITIGPRKGAWGYYDPPGKIALAERFITKQHAVAVLAHEMVHHWQYSIDENPRMDHGQSFQSWAPRFEKHSIKLAVHGNVHCGG